MQQSPPKDWYSVNDSQFLCFAIVFPSFQMPTQHKPEKAKYAPLTIHIAGSPSSLPTSSFSAPITSTQGTAEASLFSTIELS